MDITRSADKVICLIYKEFLDRRDSGASIEDARDFSVVTEAIRYESCRR